VVEIVREGGEACVLGTENDGGNGRAMVVAVGPLESPPRGCLRLLVNGR
jgi:hypothetical protein